MHTLDLVVLAVERGSGRRTGTLSNIHLGARDPVSGGFVMLGKTFKGMTDAMLAWQTEHFLTLAVGPTDGYVTVKRIDATFDNPTLVARSGERLAHCEELAGVRREIVGNALGRGEHHHD